MWATVASAALLGAACALALLPATRLTAAPAAVPRDAWAAPAGTARVTLPATAQLVHPRLSIPLPVSEGRPLPTGHSKASSHSMLFGPEVVLAVAVPLAAFAVFLITSGRRRTPAGLLAPLHAKKTEDGFNQDWEQWSGAGEEEMPAPRPIVGRGPDKPTAAKPKKDRWSLEDWQPSPEVQAAWERAKADGTADLHWTDTLVGKKWDGQDEWPGGWDDAEEGDEPDDSDEWDLDIDEKEMMAELEEMRKEDYKVKRDNSGWPIPERTPKTAWGPALSGPAEMPPGVDPSTWHPELRPPGWQTPPPAQPAPAAQAKPAAQPPPSAAQAKPAAQPPQPAARMTSAAADRPPATQRPPAPAGPARAGVPTGVLSVAGAAAQPAPRGRQMSATRAEAAPEPQQPGQDEDPEEFWGIPEEDAQAEAALRSSFGAPARWQPAARRGDGADAMMEGRPAQDLDDRAVRPKAVIRVKSYMAARDFVELGVDYDIAQALKQCGFSRPTPIQCGAFRPIAQGQDVVLASETGSGKTLAYMLPLLQVALTQPMKILVLQPNRELCMQAEMVLGQLLDALPAAKKDRLRLENISGEALTEEDGTPIPPPAPVESETHILISTPEKLLREYDKRILSFDVAVLDEGDYIMNSLRNLIEKVFDLFREEVVAPRQWVVVGATMPGVAIEGYENTRMVILSKWPDATWVRTSGLHRLSSNLEQHFVAVTPQTRNDQLVKWMDEIKETPGYRVLIFAVKRDDVEKVTKLLQEKGFNATAFHKHINPASRIARLRRFNEGEVPILVCSPAGARGLDFRDVTHVINYAFPENAVEYVHCVGRTARNGAPGWAATMYLPEEEILAESMQVLIEAGEPLERAFGRTRKFSVIKKGPVEERLELAKVKWDRRKRKQISKKRKKLVKEMGWFKAQKIIENDKWELLKKKRQREKVESQAAYMAQKEERQRQKEQNQRLREVSREAKKSGRNIWDDARGSRQNSGWGAQDGWTEPAPGGWTEPGRWAQGAKAKWQAPPERSPRPPRDAREDRWGLSDGGGAWQQPPTKRLSSSW